MVEFQGSNKEILKAFDFCWEKFGNSWHTEKSRYLAYGMENHSAEEWKTILDNEARRMIEEGHTPIIFYVSIVFDNPQDEMLFKLIWG